MAKSIIIKITRSGSRVGPFNIYDINDNIIDENVSLSSLIEGVVYSVDDSVEFVKLVSIGKCSNEKVKAIGVVEQKDLIKPYIRTFAACVWRHLTDSKLFNSFYGSIEPYIIEYPFAYNYQDEILQSIKDYTKVYKYSSGIGPFIRPHKIEMDSVFFNKAVVYNGQQSSGLLELVPKPKNNLSEYMKYPMFYTDKKKIIFTKSDNFYQYNTFWSVVKDKTQPLFVQNCSTLSIDKDINQSNMDYSQRSFKKEPLRAKELRIRHVLDNRSDVHLVSQFIVQSSQISYK